MTAVTRPALREQPFLFGDTAWIHVWDGNATAAALYDRHYSRNAVAADDRPRVGAMGARRPADAGPQCDLFAGHAA